MLIPDDYTEKTKRGVSEVLQFCIKEKEGAQYNSLHQLLIPLLFVLSFSKMDEHIVFADKIPPSFDPTGTLFKNIAEAKGSQTRLIVLLVVGGLMTIFLFGNYALYTFARKSLPPQKKKKKKKKKPVSMKKLRKEKLKQGVSARGG